MKKRYMESTERSRRVTPRMMEYLRCVIDTPTVGSLGKYNVKAPADSMGFKLIVFRLCVSDYWCDLYRFPQSYFPVLRYIIM